MAFCTRLDNDCPKGPAATRPPWPAEDGRVTLVAVAAEPLLALIPLKEATVLPCRGGADCLL
jgi:hypothetical protein